jgi:hypothetical protein
LKSNYFLAIGAIILSQFAKAQFAIYNSSNSGLTDNYCWYINENPAGKVWVGTTSTGACTYDGNNWVNYNTANSGISANYITPIAFDTNGVWLGSAYSNPGGLSKFNGTNWITYNTSNSNIPTNEMFAISVDKFNTKWIGTRYNGLAKLNDNTWSNFNTNNSNIQGNEVYSLDVDTLGNVWVGCAHTGVSKFNGTTWTKYNTSNSQLSDNDIYSIQYNKITNSVWIGTANGISILNLTSNAWINFNTSNTPNFPGNYVRGISHSYSNGKTYIATGNGGIGMYDGTNWVTYNMSNSNLPSNLIWAIKAGNFGKVWAATFGGGIVSLIDSNTTQTPNSCNVVFTDNFSNSSAWVFNSDNSVTINNGSLIFNNSVNGQYNKVYKNLGTTLSNNNWKAEFTFELSNLNSNSTMGAYAIALTAGNQDFMTTDANGSYIETNQDALAVIGTSDVPGEHDVNNWYFLMEDKKGNIRNWNLTTGIHMNPSILKYYLRFERINGNTTKLSVFSDSLFTSHIAGSPQTNNINALITGLNTIQHGAATPGSPSRILNAIIDNDFICQSSPTNLSQNNFKNADLFRFYPNPTNSSLNLNYHLNQYKNANFQLFDVQGKLVYQTELSTNEYKTVLALDKLDNGLYFGKVYADGILIKTEKIVKSN